MRTGVWISWRPPIAIEGYSPTYCSTIGAVELNFYVRYGKTCLRVYPPVEGLPACGGFTRLWRAGRGGAPMLKPAEYFIDMNN